MYSNEAERAKGYIKAAPWDDIFSILSILKFDLYEAI